MAWINYAEDGFEQQCTNDAEKQWNRDAPTLEFEPWGTAIAREYVGGALQVLENPRVYTKAIILDS